MLNTPPAIILSTLNAKYIHASFGLRYLLANMARHGGDDLRATHRPARIHHLPGRCGNCRNNAGRTG
jgi:hypothetical protein